MAQKYQCKLDNFDGPLDLLLHLIRRAKISIQEIFVSEITEQYLAYLQQSDMQDLEGASEFLEMAATLLYIKSRALLPRRPAEEDEEVSEEDQLVQRLTEYKRYREAAEQFGKMEARGRAYFYKLPEEIVDTRGAGTGVPGAARAWRRGKTGGGGSRGARGLCERARPDAPYPGTVGHPGQDRFLFALFAEPNAHGGGGHFLCAFGTHRAGQDRWAAGQRV